MALEFSPTSEYRELRHAINNRINSITLGLSVLELNESDEIREVVDLLRIELIDLQDLIDQLPSIAILDQ